MSRMDTIELRISKDQADLIIYGLSLAASTALSEAHKTQYVKLRAWIRTRRIKRWGDEYANAINAEAGEKIVTPAAQKD